MKWCKKKQFLMLSTMFNVACAIVVIWLLCLYYIFLPHKYQTIVNKMVGSFHGTQFPVRMHPITANEDIVIFGSDGDPKGAPLAIVIRLCGRNYLLYYDGRGYICFYEDVSKFGWRIDMNDSEPFRMIDNAASKFICERSIQYATTGGGDAP